MPRGRPRKQPGWAGAQPAPDADEPALDAPRVAAALTIADRHERAVRMTEILRDRDAKAAETVAASRELDKMDRAERGEAAQAAPGPPAPGSRTEQVVRLVKILAAAGPEVRIRALEIIADRFEAQRARIRELIGLVTEPITLPTTTPPQEPPA